MLIVLISLQRDINFLFCFNIFKRGFITAGSSAECEWSNHTGWFRPVFDLTLFREPQWAQLLALPVDIWCLILRKLLNLSSLNEEILILQHLLNLKPQKQKTILYRSCPAPPQHQIWIWSISPIQWLIYKKQKRIMFQNPTGIPGAKSQHPETLLDK